METMRSGCTVLMVSHSAESMRTLCKRGLMLSNGEIQSIGSIDKVLVDYKKSQIAQLDPTSTILREVIIHYSKIKNDSKLSTESDFEAEVEFTVTEPIENCHINYLIEDNTGKIVVHTRTNFNGNSPSFNKGNYRAKIRIPRLGLNEGGYSSWFRFSHEKEYGEYALDTPRKEFDVAGRKEKSLAVIDVPAEWEWKKK